MLESPSSDDQNKMGSNSSGEDTKLPDQDKIVTPSKYAPLSFAGSKKLRKRMTGKRGGNRRTEDVSTKMAFRQ